MGSKIAVIVLNWNGAHDTLACLHSLETVTYPEFFIIVVDNGSDDDSAQLIADGYQGITMIKLRENLGYAGGNNVGIRYAMEKGSDIICILNNDIIVSPDFLTPLIEVLASSPDLGVVTPLISESVNRGLIWALGLNVDQNSASVVRNHAGESIEQFEQGVSFDVDAASGAAMLIKRDVIERVGLLDEDFFLYYEEIDWCLYVKRFGFQILAVPSSIVWHQVSATMGETSPIIDYYMQRNQLRFISRHWSGLKCWYIWLRTFLLGLITIGAFTLKSHENARIPHRNARLFALRDAVSRKWGPMGKDVEQAIF